MEKAIVLYDIKSENWKKAYVQTLAGQEVVVSCAFVEKKYFEIMVFQTDNHGRIVNYSEYEMHRLYERADAEEMFETVIEAWRNETRTLEEIDPNHAVLL